MTQEIDAVPYDAPAVERGVGFFETVLLLGRRAVCWEQHIARLLSSLARFDLPSPSREEIAQAAAQATAHVSSGSQEESGLRLTWIALRADLEDKASWRLDASARPIPAATLGRRKRATGVSLPTELTRDTPTCKSTSYLAAVLGSRYARRHGSSEGLFVAADGSYIEGASTALIAWSDGALAASPYAALQSVTAQAFAAEPARRPLTAALLREGAILLGSLTRATPLCALDGMSCAMPPSMLARIKSFNAQLDAHATLL